jgi:uncharacterized protein
MPLQPVDAKERYQVLDVVRGVALFGVLLVNLLYFFRVSLFAHILNPESGAIDRFVAVFLEFKAFDLFALSFGVGVAVQAERAAKRGVNTAAFLARRFLILLAFGALHMALVSNVDILCLYAICGLALIPLLRLRWQWLLSIAVAAILLQRFIPGLPFPSATVLRAHAAEATRVYSQASYREIVAFRWHETVTLILPVLAGVAVQAYALMLGGMAVWRAGIVRDRAHHRRALWIACAVAVAAWAVTRENVPLAIAYGAALLAYPQSGRWSAPFAAAGRMAFTNYLTQSIVFAVVFNGFGLFGAIATAPAAAFGVALYAAQLAWSVWWLKRHRFGPFEWLWRSLTYGRRV